MGYYVFQRNVTKPTSSFMLICVLIWFAVGVVDWLRGQNFIIIVILMDFWWSLSLSLSLPLLFVCVFWVWSIIEGINKIEIEILNEQSHREHRDRDLHGSDLDICPMAGIEMKNLLKRVTTIVAQNKTLYTPNELFLTNNKYYGYKVGLATFCGDYVTK